MPRFLPADLTRLALPRITVILALLAGFALSPKLWLSSRLYPLLRFGLSSGHSIRRWMRLCFSL
jgi:hypothetical protein